ncbi:carbohydrate binding domain-containing protein [Halobacillus massiliensis]|uniref:carbohydrate binding domain-containing protein n=1 Tax=Halobacillus massiliensis TaxID=1926286 RepID=UPI0009E2ACF6|nr:carbohydrate binding domain-containing protein [Halobacillus massiliensis]
MNVAAEERELHLNIQKEGSKTDDIVIKQSGIPLKESAEYELSFDARAQHPKEIEVEVVNEDGSKSYSSTTISLTEDMLNQRITFKIPEEEPKAQLLFKAGGKSGDIYLDNVKMIQTSIDEEDLNPLKNGDFSSGLDYWEEYIHFDAQAQVTDNNERINIDIQEAGNEPWSVLVEQKGLQLKKGYTYVLSFEANSTQDRDIEITLENAEYQRFFEDKVSLKEEEQRFEYEFEMPADDQVSLKFLMGQAESQHKISIDNVILKVKND